MVHHDIEKKCHLLTRFIVENLYGYSEKVRENLPVYLNTSEKVRLRISRNSFTLTDRTIWHNKIERIPISLIKECKVDTLSPKICYFANETVTNRYQIVVLLCKSADDSFKLVNILQQKINSQGYYRAHNHWLQNGSFSNAQQQLSPNTKHKTIASVEVANSPKFGWRSSQSRTLSETPDFLDQDDLWSYKLSPLVPSRNSKICVKKSNHVDRASQLTLTNDDSCCQVPVTDQTASVEASCNLSQDVLESHQGATSSNSKPFVDQTRRRRIVPPLTADENNEVKVIMRRAKNINNRNSSAGYKRSVCVRESMRSTIVQYDSDDGEDGDKTEKLQHNSNGIARVVVGGNDSEKTSSSKSLNHVDESADVAAETGEDTETDRTSGDGANSSDANIASADDITDNSLDGVYDNVAAIKESIEEKEESKFPVLETECVEPEVSVPAPISEVAPEKGASSEDDEDYELVLTDLKLLTRGLTRLDSSPAVEPRYPHQIIAARSVSQLSNSMSTSQLSTTESITNHTKPEPSAKLPTISDAFPLPTPPNNDPDVQKRVRSNSREVLPRPQSTASGLHLIRGKNDLRRSTRRKGQYTSIAEYEKMQGQAQESKPEEISKSKVDDVSARNGRRNRNSVCTSTLSSSNNLTPPMSARNRSTKHERSAPQSASNSGKAFQQVNSNFSGEKKLSKERDMSSRRTSLLSMASVPNNIVLRRVQSPANTAHISTSPKDGTARSKAKSRSLDRRNTQMSVIKMADEGVSQNGLTLIGSRNSLISHGKSAQDISDSMCRLRRHKPTIEPSMGERFNSKLSIVESNKVQPMKATVQCSQPPEYKKKSRPKTQYIALPNAPEWPFFRPQPSAISHTDLNVNVWEQNPGFKRFFESIMTYGPAANKSNTPSHSNKKKILNQPDIVLESLTLDDLPRADNSDSESSIRSSASAYWPPELKQQPNFSDDFEETASWKFHSPPGKNRRLINVS